MLSPAALLAVFGNKLTALPINVLILFTSIVIFLNLTTNQLSAEFSPLGGGGVSTSPRSRDVTSGTLSTQSPKQSNLLGPSISRQTF